MVKPNKVSDEKLIEASGGIVVRGTPLTTDSGTTDSHNTDPARTDPASTDYASNGPTPQVLVVHRPAYGDWTFPKGKNEPGEDPLEAASREVAEETGQTPRVVFSLGETKFDTGKGRKRVQWFGMRAADSKPFTPNDEVDEIRWLSADDASSLLTYDDDRLLLADVDLDGLLTTGTLYLVRHGAAGDRGSWQGEDETRPLTSKGMDQAAGLVTLLKDRQIEAILTSPFLRCRQTVEPLAEAVGLGLVEHPALAEGQGGRETRDLIRQLAGTNAILCSHGDVIPSAMDWMVRKGLTLKSPFDCKKGSVWEVEIRAGEFHKARYILPSEA
jgi:8-oxo-dGTP diphosphatase